MAGDKRPVAQQQTLQPLGPLLPQVPPGLPNTGGTHYQRKKRTHRSFTKQRQQQDSFRPDIPPPAAFSGAYLPQPGLPPGEGSWSVQNNPQPLRAPPQHLSMSWSGSGFFAGGTGPHCFTGQKSKTRQTFRRKAPRAPHNTNAYLLTERRRKGALFVLDFCFALPDAGACFLPPL